MVRAATIVYPYHAGLHDSERKWSVMKDARGNGGFTTERADDFLLFITCATLMIRGETRLEGVNCRTQCICLVR